MFTLSNSIRKNLSGLFILAMFIIPFVGSSQNKVNGNLGIRGTASISANRFGTIYCPSLYYKSERNLLSLGVTLQKNKVNPTGVQLNYEYTLVDPALDNGCNLEWLEFYAFINFTYHNKAYLGKAVCEEERYSNSELTIDPSKLQLKEIDSYLGFGLRIMLTKNLRWFNGIGIGAFGVFNSPDQLFYNSKGLGLLLRTGVSYQFGKHGKGKF